MTTYVARVQIPGESQPIAVVGRARNRAEAQQGVADYVARRTAQRERTEYLLANADDIIAAAAATRAARAARKGGAR